MDKLGLDWIAMAGQGDSGYIRLGRGELGLDYVPRYTAPQAQRLRRRRGADRGEYRLDFLNLINRWIVISMYHLST
jgi:hypothetical protein